MDEQSLDERKKAYTTLGVPEDATLEQVEQRYEIWIRRSKRQPGDPRLAEATAAYKLIKKVLQQQDESNTPPRSLWAERFQHFWEYYRLHTIGAIIGLIVIVSIVQGIVESQRQKAYEASLPPIDVSVMLVGEYFMAGDTPDFTPMEAEMFAVMPEWQRVKIELLYSPLEARDSFDIGMQQKALVTLATEHPDIYITDEGNFTRLASQGGFLPLDDYEAELAAGLGSDRLVYAQEEGSPDKQLLGLDVTGTSLFTNLAISDQKKIISVRVNADEMDKAIAWLLRLRP